MKKLNKQGSSILFKFFDFECDVVTGAKIFLSLFTLTHILHFTAVVIRDPYHWWYWSAELLALAVIFACTLLAFSMKSPTLMWPFIIASIIWFASSLGVMIVYVFMVVVIVFVPESEPQLSKIIAILGENDALPLLWICLVTIGVALVLIALTLAVQLTVVVHCRAYYMSLPSNFFVNENLHKLPSTAYKLPCPIPIDINTSAAVNIPNGYMF